MNWFRVVTLVLLLPFAAMAQSAPDPEELADIKAELAGLNAEIETLRQLIVTESTGQGISAGIGPAILRLDRLEAELRLINGRVEKLGNYVDRVVQDGTTRIGDLEFRLTELAGGDLSAIGEAPRLGNVDGNAASPATQTAAAIPQQPEGKSDTPSAEVVTPPKPRSTPDVALAVTEESDFDAAMTAFGDGEMAKAIILFGAFLADFPGGPLSVDAMYHLGEAQAQLGQHRQAAQSYLDTFTADPQGERAPFALLRVGTSLGHLNQVPQACQTLQEVILRYPGHPVEAEARSNQDALGCV